VLVSGTGYSYGTTVNDAFFGVKTGKPLDPQYYQLNLGWNAAPLKPYSGESRNISNFIKLVDGIGKAAVPTYNSNHSYHFVIEVPKDAGRLSFGVSDGGFDENGGQYNIEINPVKKNSCQDSSNNQAWYRLVSKQNGKCMHVHGGGKANGTNITLWDCVNQSNVQWRFVPTSEQGYLFLKARHSGMCAHVHGNANNNGGNITQWNCINQDNVKWSKKDLGDGYFQLIAKNSGKCAHVHGGGNANGTNITQWDCSVNQDNLKWRVELVK
jgi:hypothetical protein